jgi:hypothetical protein
MFVSVVLPLLTLNRSKNVWQSSLAAVLAWDLSWPRLSWSMGRKVHCGGAPINIVYITGRRPEKLQDSVDKLNAIREGSAIAFLSPHRVN